MFSFQAIHNCQFRRYKDLSVVYRLCQCSLFKQFTTLNEARNTIARLFIDYVNVLFSSNSQPWRSTWLITPVVYRLCQCSLFKQFTTIKEIKKYGLLLFIDYVNVLFSSNSQPYSLTIKSLNSCLSIMSMFSFQAIHNWELNMLMLILLFIDYVNVLFSSNSQRYG